MKKTMLWTVVSCLLMALLAGCQQADEPIFNQEESTTGQTQQMAGPVTCQAKYIRTNAARDGVSFPSVQVIGSRQELTDYYDSYKDILDLESRQPHDDGTGDGFLDVCDGYDESFFAEQFLVFVLLEEGSGAVSHQVRSVEKREDGVLAVSIDKTVPEVGTCDMAQWHIILELRRQEAGQDLDTLHTHLQVFADEQLIWNGQPVTPAKPAPAFTAPPEGFLMTPLGEYPLHMGGYSWLWEEDGRICQAVTADQAVRPLDGAFLQAVVIDGEFAESVHIPDPETGEQVPTNMMGYFAKLNWQAQPDSVTGTWWPEGTGGMGEPLDVTDGCFYARQGRGVYEFVATWENNGAGYYGTANYYACIIGGEDQPAQSGDPGVTLSSRGGTCAVMAQPTAEDGDALTELLKSVSYNPNFVCKCLPEYTVELEDGSAYGVHLSEGYARCDAGQANLTEQQVEKLRQIIEKYL